ncbi:hypothetical protein GCM10009648_14960 [Tsukamurella spumae]
MTPSGRPSERHRRLGGLPEGVVGFRAAEARNFPPARRCAALASATRARCSEASVDPSSLGL